MEKPNLKQNKDFTIFLAELIIELNLNVQFETDLSFDKWEEDTALIKQTDAYINGVHIPSSVSQNLLKEIENKTEV